MRIAFHALSIHPGRTGGAETYARRLLQQLQEIDHENQYYVIAPRGCDAPIFASNFQRIDCAVDATATYGRVAWEQGPLVRLLRRLCPDLTHFPASTAPFRYERPSVVTIHDTLRFQIRRTGLPLLQLYYQWNQRRIVRSGKRVIAVSQADARVMSRNLRLDERKLSVIPLGVDEMFFESPDDDRKDAEPYLLWIGRWYPHKNLETLAEACRRLDERSVAYPRVRLVGLSAAEQARCASMLDRKGVRERFALEGPAPADRLPALYRGAAAFCFPSRVESFGLPVLEALAAGTPVVAADLPALRELHGDRIAYFPADDPSSLADQLAAVLRDPTRRKTLREAGRQHARQFTWRRCAEQTLELYRRLERTP